MNRDLQRRGIERRVHRLATLLTGDPGRAAAVVDAVLDAQPDPRRLDSARLDRLTILRCRELARSNGVGEGATLVAEGVPTRLTEALGRMPAQQREAWVLTRVYRLPERESARAMDCSVTALRRHVERADGRVATAFGAPKEAPAGVESALEALRRWTSHQELPDDWIRRRRGREQRSRIGLLVAIAAGILALLWIIDRISPG